MNIGLYFGSFNPIHIGHLIIARHFLNETVLDEVWFVVSPQNPFKQTNGLLNEYDRLHLVSMSIEGETNMRASSIEFNLPKPSYTIDTLTYLEEKNPRHTYHILMGSDGFKNVAKWKNSAALMNKYHFMIYKRPGFDVENDVGASVTIMDAPYLQISSTHIRKLVKEKKSIRYLVTDAVMEEIDKNNYYTH